MFRRFYELFPTYLVISKRLYFKTKKTLKISPVCISLDLLINILYINGDAFAAKVADRVCHSSVVTFSLGEDVFRSNSLSLPLETVNVLSQRPESADS